MAGIGVRKDNFDKFTDRARRALDLAHEEALHFNHDYLGTEHVLLGLLRVEEGVAASVLAELGATTARLRAEILRILALGRSTDETAATRANVISCRIDASDLAAIDALVEAGIRGTRSEAAAWLIHTGITAHRSLFEQVHSTVTEIRRLRSEAQAIAEGLTGEGADAAPPAAGVQGGQEEPAAPGGD